VSSDLAGDRDEALLKEAEITAEQQRAAGVSLASLSLAAADGDKQAAKGILREALSAIGMLPYEPLSRPKSSRMQVINNYERH